MSAARGWGSGWPRCQTGDVITALCEGGLRLPVRKQIALPVIVLVARLSQARGRPFRPDWSWGFACRAIAGTRIPSQHSWALSVDLDAPENPHLAASTHARPHPLRKSFPGGLVMRSTMPGDVQSTAGALGFRWGGTFGRPDPMHFEYVGTPADAKRLTDTLAAQLRALANAGAPPATVTVLRPGASGPAVRKLQDDLKAVGAMPTTIGSTGGFGAQTEAAVRRFQLWETNRGADTGGVDGIAGPKTQAVLAWRLAGG